jgi:hypothetical protein
MTRPATAPCLMCRMWHRMTCQVDAAVGAHVHMDG